MNAEELASEPCYRPCGMPLLRKLFTALIVLAVVAAQGLSAAWAARAPTYLEQVTIMDAFNTPGRSFASKCVRIRVSTVDSRYAILGSPLRIPAACRAAGQVGDGFVLFVRSTPAALRWRDIFEGSESPPCKVPRTVLRDLLGSASCT